MWLALTEATVDNGCPRVAPGLHRLGTLAHHYVEPLGWECLTDMPDAHVAEVPAGGAVVFSSLTPHLTGPNPTTDVRKAYILQYAPSGAAVQHGDPATGASSGTTPCDDGARQYEVLRAGEPVAVGLIGPCAGPTTTATCPRTRRGPPRSWRRPPRPGSSG